ncbi:hypothetical protein [Actinoallomurus oryzae]|uniref:hypothetical protein n=1 Tax=Actinoallomurus oryzae TaxID=502180 RepID=UPI0031E817F0
MVRSKWLLPAAIKIEIGQVANGRLRPDRAGSFAASATPAVFAVPAVFGALAVPALFGATGVLGATGVIPPDILTSAGVTAGVVASAGVTAGVIASAGVTASARFAGRVDPGELGRSDAAVSADVATATRTARTAGTTRTAGTARTAARRRRRTARVATGPAEDETVERITVAAGSRDGDVVVAVVDVEPDSIEALVLAPVPVPVAVVIEDVTAGVSAAAATPPHRSLGERREAAADDGPGRGDGEKTAGRERLLEHDRYPSFSEWCDGFRGPTLLVARGVPLLLSFPHAPVVVRFTLDAW